jgi:sugar/nucleoside kinase (ribokinase family)
MARDSFGQFMLARLQEKKVNTDHIVFTKEKSTGATVALSFDEDRAMVTYPGAMSLFQITHIPDTLFHRARHLHVSSIFLSTGLKKDIYKLFQKAKSSGMTTSLDPQWDPDERWDIDFKKLLEVVDVFIPNENELRAITGMDDIRSAVSQLRAEANIVVVKSGRDGAFLWKGELFIHQPAFLNDNVVDTIGAGDSFGAGFIHQFIQGKTMEECLEFATLIGAINTTRAGGTTAFQNLSEVKAIAELTFNQKI